MPTPASLVTIAAVGPVSTAAACHRHRGVLRVTLVAKVTLALVHEGTARVEPTPDPIATAERHHRDNPMASIRLASDLAPYLPRAEVVLTGHAYAPTGEPRSSLVARLAVGRDAPLVDKRVHVLGDRGVPFQRVPLVYERAYGGPGFRDNPLGVGFSGSGTPSLVDPERPGHTACFGPIARAWPSRKQRIAADARKALDAPLPELADDFDFAYFQQAPEDQRLGRLEGDEWIVLEGMHPSLERLRTTLPGVRVVARVDGLGAPGPVELSLAADTLRIDTDRQIASLTFRASTPVATVEALNDLRALVALSIAGAPIVWPREMSAIAASDPRAARPAPKVTNATMALGDGDLEIVDDEPAPPAFTTRGTVILEPAPEPRAPAAPTASPFEGTLVLDETTQRSLAAPGASPTGPAFLDARPAPPSSPPLPPPPMEAPPPTARFAGTFAIGEAELAAIAKLPATPFVPTPPGVTPSIALTEPPVARPHPLSGTLDVTPEQHAEAARRSATPFHEPIVERFSEAPSVRGIEVESAARFFHSIERPSAAVVEAEPEPRVVVPERKSEIVPVLHDDDLVVTTVTWQVRPPRETLTILAKRTYDLVPGRAVRARMHTDLPSGDRYRDGDPKKSIRYPSDYAIFKPRADVMLLGTAHAPGGSTTGTMVRFRFGHEGNAFDRKIGVYGRRVWHKGLLGLSPTEPEPFTTMPLFYEGAFGGENWSANPVGTGHAPAANTELPNLEDPAHLVMSSKDSPPPACFGPISPYWKERWSKLGTYDSRWLKSRWPYFPEDFDWTHFQSAPVAQRLDYLKGDEPFAIFGMHPEHAILEGTLPGVRVRGFAQETEAAGGRFREITLRLDTAFFDVDSMRLDLVWRGLVEVSDEEAPEIQALFVIEERLDAEPVTLDEARDRLLRKLVSLQPIPGEPVAPVNDAPPPAPEAEPARHPRLVELEADLERRRVERLELLRKSGIPESSIAEALAPREPGDPRKVLELLRTAKNAPPELLESFEKVLDPDPIAPEPSARARLLARIAEGGSLDGLDAQGEDLTGVDLTGRSLVRANFKDARLVGAVLTKANLDGANLAGAILEGASLEGATLDNADLHGAKLEGARLDRASIAYATFSEAHAEKVSFCGVTGLRARFDRARLADANFDEAEIPRADFMHAELPRARFVEADLEDAVLFGVRAEGARFDDAKLSRAGLEGADLSRASFVGVRAPGSNWEKAKLSLAHFDRAELEGASFIRATCDGALFSRADLRRSCLRRASLVDAKLLKADLLSASLERADLRDADLRGANLHAAETWKANLEGAKLDLAIITKTKLRGHP
jgi:uncharacterized protein YjbI with pentapeptide repeats